MPAPGAYLDECVDHNLLARLRLRDFQVTSALEQGRANTSDPDDAQLAFATARDWVLVSHNERDFRVLHQACRREGRLHGGIIILSDYATLDRLTIRTAMMLDWLGRMPHHRSQFFKWGRLQELLERAYRLPGYTEDEVRLVLAR
jgi:hypothetical protein